MAVLIEAISAVIRADKLLLKFPGGWDRFKEFVPNNTLCADDELVRVGFMSPTDVKSFIAELNSIGLEYIINGHANDMVVVDQIKGFMCKCSWAEFGKINIGNESNEIVATCRLVGSKLSKVITPPLWIYEGSLSNSFGFTPTESLDKGLKYLRHENGIDVYINRITGKEVYIGRTGKNPINNIKNF